MGLCAVAFWCAFCGGDLPRWVWWFVIADWIIRIPGDIVFYSKFFH